MASAFVHPLGLNKSQFKLIQDCLWARTVVPNGHFLAASRWRLAAERLIERGYLTKAPPSAQPVPSISWAPVVFITDDNIDAYNRDLAKAQEAE